MSERDFNSWGKPLFGHLSDQQLIERIENAGEFQYDDEQVELNRRLGRAGLAWMWQGDKIEVFPASFLPALDELHRKPDDQEREEIEEFESREPVVTIHKPIEDYDTWQELHGVPVEPGQPSWSPRRALGRLGLRQVEYEPHDEAPTGTAYVKGEAFAIRETAPIPLRTLLHELGHVVLGHTSDNAPETFGGYARGEMHAEAIGHLGMTALGASTRLTTLYSRDYMRYFKTFGQAPWKDADTRLAVKGVNEVLKAGGES